METEELVVAKSEEDRDCVDSTGGENETQPPAEQPGKNAPAGLSPISPSLSEYLRAKLPGTIATKYKNGQVIYGGELPVNALYLILEGRVKISRLAGTRQRVVVDIYRESEIFGECALLGRP